MSWRIDGSRHVEDSFVLRFCHPNQYIHGWGIGNWKTSSLPIWLVTITMPSKVPSVPRDKSECPLHNNPHHLHHSHSSFHIHPTYSIITACYHLIQCRGEWQKSNRVRSYGTHVSLCPVSRLSVWRRLEPSTRLLLHVACPSRMCLFISYVFSPLSYRTSRRPHN